MSVSEILVLIRWFNALWALIHATSYPTLVLFTWLWRSVAPNGPMDTLRQRVWVSFIMNQGNVRIIALWKPSTWEIARKKHRSCGEWVAVVVVAGRGPGRGRPRGRSRGSGRARGGGGCFCCCCCCGGAAAFSWYMNVDETVVYIHAFQYLQFTTIHVQFSGNGWNSSTELPVAIPNPLKFHPPAAWWWLFVWGDMYHLGEYEIWMASEGGQLWGQRVGSWLLPTCFMFLDFIPDDLCHQTQVTSYLRYTCGPMTLVKNDSQLITQLVTCGWCWTRWLGPLPEAYDIFSKSSGSAGSLFVS